MSKSRTEVASIAAEREAQQVKKAFLDLVHADLYEHPERIEPIPESLFARMDRLREKAQASRESNELPEG